MVFSNENAYHPYSYARQRISYACRCIDPGRLAIQYRITTAAARQAPATTSGWLRQQLPAQLGECYTERVQVDTGLVLVRSRYLPRCDLIEESIQRDGPRTLVITLGLEGESGFYGHDGARLGFRGGYTTVSSFAHSTGERRYQAGTAVGQLRLLVEEATLRRYVGEARCRDLLPAARVRELGFGKTAPASAAHARALLRLASAAPADPLALQIHALSLLAGQLRELRPPASTQPPAQPTAPGRLSQHDIQKLEQIRDLMQLQMAQPLTIDYLCASAGLSTFKLKQGFRLLFNTSPHQMLLEMRMRRAWTLLEAGCQVAQAGWQVGYLHPSNFSTAFTRFFGRAPKSVSGKGPGKR